MMMKIAACLAAACALAGRPRRRSSVGTKRRPTTKAPLVAPPTFVAATICRAQETNEDAFSPLAVPERCRGAEAATRPWFKHVGLDTLFPGAGLGEVFDESSAVWKSKFFCTFVLNRRVVLHAINATPARWRGGAGSSPLDRASAATSSPRNDLVENCWVHPTH